MAKKLLTKSWVNGFFTKRDRPHIGFASNFLYLEKMGYMKKQFFAFASLIMGCQVFAQTVITKPKFIYPGHSDLIEGVAFSPDGKYLFSSSWDKNINMYSADSVWLIKKIGGHNAAVTQIAFTRPRNKPMLIATASKDFSVKGWDSVGVLKNDFL